MRNKIKLVLFNWLWPLAKLLLRIRPGLSLAKVAPLLVFKGDIVLDVGANIGEVSFIFSQCVGSEGRVHAIEPIANLCDQIRRRNEQSRYKNIQVHEIVFSRTVGEMEFFIDTRQVSCASSLSREHVKNEVLLHGATFSKTRVPATTLDQFCAANMLIPNFIKIDTEGAEDSVIDGGMEILQNHHPIIWFELWCGNGVNSKLSHIKLLRDIGYELYIATIFFKGGKWVRQKDDSNVRNFSLLTDDALNGARLGMDVLAMKKGKLLPSFNLTHFLKNQSK